MKMSRNAATLNVSFEVNFESFPSLLAIVQVNLVTRDVNTEFSKYHHKNVTIWEANKVLTVVVNLLKDIINSFTTRDTLARCTRHALHRAPAPRNHVSTRPIERMHSRVPVVMQTYWNDYSNKKMCWQEKSWTPTGLVWFTNMAFRFIVLEHQYGCHDVMRMRSITVIH